MTFLDSVSVSSQPATASLVVLSAFILSSSAAGQDSGLFSPIEPERVRAVSTTSPNQPALRQRLVAIDFRMLAAAHDLAVRPAAAPATLRLNLFDDVEFTAIVDETYPTSSGYSLHGNIQQGALATMSLVVNGRVVAGTVRTPEATYLIRTAGMGVYSIAELDPSMAREEGEPVIVPPPIREAVPVSR